MAGKQTTTEAPTKPTRPRRASPRTPKRAVRPGVRIERLRIENLKCIDDLEIEFPPPFMADDPDVFVLGSRNGVGKTTVLGACALLLLGLSWKDRGPVVRNALEHAFRVNLAELLIRAGVDTARVTARLVLDGVSAGVQAVLHRSGHLRVEVLDGDENAARSLPDRVPRFRYQLAGALPSLGGLDADPLLIPACAYFHSYRKVREGRPELGEIMEGDRRAARLRESSTDRRPGVSAFKAEVLRVLMSRADLLDTGSDASYTKAYDVLGGLLATYAQGAVEKLRLVDDNTVEIPVHRDSSAPFPFDGLSSGQKEMIANLFLVWQHTYAYPCVVLIDEPELHLNAEWHRTFVHHLTKLARGNQYILATHSEDVFDSVPSEHRIMLREP